jgi:hypothetical protein
MDTIDARSALEAKQSAEAQMARAAICPPWRHALFGLMMGTLVSSPAFDMPLRVLIVGSVLLMIPVIVHYDRKRMGMFINGYRRGKTRVVAFAIVAAELLLYCTSLVLGLDHHDHVTPVLLGQVGIVVGIVGSIMWQRVFVREMGA